WSRTSAMLCTVNMRYSSLLPSVGAAVRPRTVRHPSETVLFRRKTAVLHCRIIGTEGIINAGLPGKEILHETRGLARRDAKQVVHHQHLAVAFRAGANADHRDAHGRGQLGGRRTGYALEQQQVGTG